MPRPMSAQPRPGRVGGPSSPALQESIRVLRREVALDVTRRMEQDGCDQADLDRVFDEITGYREPMGNEY